MSSPEHPSPTAAESSTRHRVLHVVQPWSAPPGATAWACHAPAADRCDAALRACVGTIAGEGMADEFAHTVLVVGGSQAVARARALGLKRFDQLSPTLGRASFGARVFGRYLLERGPFDVVHLWGSSLERLELRPRDARAMFVTDTRSGQVRQIFNATGTRDSRTWNLPPASMGWRDLVTYRSKREALRRRHSLHPEDVAIALLADPPDAGHVARFTFLVTLLRVSGLRAVAILDPNGREAGRGLASRRALLLEREPILVDGPLDKFLPACDIGVCGVGSRFMRAPDPVTWGLASVARLAMDVGVPVANASPGLLPQEVEDTMTAHSPHPAAIARTIARLCEQDGGVAAVRRQLIERPRNQAIEETPAIMRQVWQESLA